MKFLLVGLLFVNAAAMSGPWYGVRVSTDKQTDFATLKTYAWTTTWTAFDPEIERGVAAAVDRELAALGLQRVDSGVTDVVVTFVALRRMDVDVKRRQVEDPTLHVEYPVGTLVVLILDAQSRRELFRGRGDTPLAPNPAEIQAQITDLVGLMFTKYPTRKSD